MIPTYSRGPLIEELHRKYLGYAWYNELVGYLSIRYRPIETRILNSLRYVELHPRNKDAFSYEFGSIIRDVGSIFGSTLEKLVRNTAKETRDRYDIRDYLQFLVDEVKDVDLMGAELNSPFRNRVVLPFENIKDATLRTSERLAWWDAYNNLKHSDFENYESGCLKHVIYGIASLAVLFGLMTPWSVEYIDMPGKLFYQIGLFFPGDKAKECGFPR